MTQVKVSLPQVEAVLSSRAAMALHSWGLERRPERRIRKVSAWADL